MAFSDDYMIFNEKSKRYVLTQKCLFDQYGIDLIDRLDNVNQVNAVLNQISIQIYTFIHSFTIKNNVQDYILHNFDSARDILRRAMEQQAVFYCYNGDLSKTLDKEKREMYIDPIAKDILSETIPEYRVSILYTGA